MPVPAIYLLRTSPCASSVLPSIAAEAFGRAALVVDGLHELAASSGNSPTITRRLVVSYTHLLTLAPSLAKRGGAVIFFSPNQPSPTASTFRSGVPCAARTFLSSNLSEGPAADRSSASLISNIAFDSAKVRISERKTKGKLVFLCFPERKCLRRSQRYEDAAENQRKTCFSLFSRAKVASVKPKL